LVIYPEYRYYIYCICWSE